jgi:hypothetical protein
VSQVTSFVLLADGLEDEEPWDVINDWLHRNAKRQRLVDAARNPGDPPQPRTAPGQPMSMELHFAGLDSVDMPAFLDCVAEAPWKDPHLVAAVIRWEFMAGVGFYRLIDRRWHEESRPMHWEDRPGGEPEWVSRGMLTD